METNKTKSDAPATNIQSIVNGIPMPVSIKTVETSSKHNSDANTRMQGGCSSNNGDNK